MIKASIKINVENYKKLAEKYSEKLIVENPEELIISEKIDSEIKKEMIIALEQSLKDEFDKNGIEANITIR
jgi:hypothetical protein